MEYLVGALIIIGACFLQTIPTRVLAIKIRLEKPIAKLYSGTWTLALWPIEKLVRWPKGQIKISLPSVKTFTREVTLSPIEGADIKAASIPVTFDVALHFNWPKNATFLIESYEEISHEDPSSQEALQDHFGAFIISVIRMVLGKISWAECREGVLLRENDVIALNELIVEELTRVNLSGIQENNPILRTHLENVRVSILNLTLPKEFEEALSAPETEQYRAAALLVSAEAERRRRHLETLSEAEARKELFSAIKEMGEEGTTLEVLYTLREMSKNSSSTLLLGLSSLLQGLMGKNQQPSEQDAATFLKSILKKLNIDET